MKKKLTALFLTLVMCMTLCVPALAYSTFGYHLKGTWFGEYYYVDNRSDGYGVLSDAAVDAWNEAVEFQGENTLDIDLIETTNGDSKKTRVVISPLDRGADGYLGFAYYYDVNPFGEWTCINYGGYPNQNYQSGSAVINRYYTDSLSDAKTQNVMMHEIGHILGLAHSSAGSDDGSLMYKGISSVSNLREPQTDDISGVRDIYE